MDIKGRRGGGKNMSINTVRKGNRRQNQSRKELEKDGWQVCVARRGWKGQEIDFFHLFDIIAYRNGYFRLIQCKSNYCPRKVKKSIRAFLTYGLFVTREVWVYKDFSRNNPWVEVIR